MRIAVLGTGYVGLVAGAGFSDFGNEVTCVDIDEAKVERLRRGEIPIYEPGLEKLVQHNVAEERLRFTTDIAEAVGNAEIVFIAVGTPSSHDGSADLSQVLSAARDIGRAMKHFTVVVTKSTVPVGTSAKVEAALAEVAKVPFAVASNPEFLKEGDAVADFMKPDRVILGTNDQRAAELLRKLYAPLVRTNDRCLVTDPISAELTKYAANAYLATRISFMNDMANLCERVGADIELVRRGMGMDVRIGNKFLFPGVGYGGSCFPKDVKAVMSTAREAGWPLGIVEAVDRVNDRQKRVLADKVLRRLTGQAEWSANALQGKVVALWGLAFKPGTDDVREAPSLTIAELLLGAGATVQGHDPVAQETFAVALEQRVDEKVRARFSLHEKPYDAAKGADALCLLTEWHQLRRPNFAKLKTLLRAPNLFDGRNTWEPADVRALDFYYEGIGRA
ncbi:MAG: UDP-glucose/GDP-mannose dehydrogenase family protein [Polyangia bacterium]